MRMIVPVIGFVPRHRPVARFSGSMVPCFFRHPIGVGFGFFFGFGGGDEACVVAFDPESEPVVLPHPENAATRQARRAVWKSERVIGQDCCASTLNRLFAFDFLRLPASRRSERQHGMKLDAVRRDAGLPMDEVEEPDTREGGRAAQRLE